MLNDDQLTERQKKWLEASRKIGPGPLTKSERKLLESLYAEMLPKEQQELQEFVQEKYGKEPQPEDQPKESIPDPTEEMEQRQWAEPSSGLRKALAKAQRSRFPFGRNDK